MAITISTVLYIRDYVDTAFNHWYDPYYDPVRVKGFAGGSLSKKCAVRVGTAQKLQIARFQGEVGAAKRWRARLFNRPHTTRRFKFVDYECRYHRSLGLPPPPPGPLFVPVHDR